MMPTPDPYFTAGRTEPGSQQQAPGVLTPLERGQDPWREEAERDLAAGAVPPAHDRDENEIIEDEIARTQRVYAPASERVPREPVPGHRDLVEHPDTDTPERQATSPTMGTMNSSQVGTGTYQSGSTGGVQPSTGYQPSPTYQSSGSERTASDAWSSINRPGISQPTPLAAVDRPTYSWDGEPARPTTHTEQRSFPIDRRVGIGLGVSWGTVIAGCVAVWLYMRWQRERNRPINRFRRQAQRTASEIGGRLPSGDELMKMVQMRDEHVRPAVSFAAALLSIAVVVLRRMRTTDPVDEYRNTARHRMERAVDRAREFGWQDRLMSLREEALRLAAR